MPESSQRPLRIAVISDGATGMCLAESLLTTRHQAPVFVDLITARTAPAGLLRSTPQGDQAPRLRLIGNVRVDEDVTVDELHELYDAVVTPDAAALATTDTATLTGAALASAEITAAVFPERPQDAPPRLLELLDARGVAVISWQGWTAGVTASTDWAAVELSSRGVPVCM
ncbi:ferredoxin--NADP+ reductase [Corynebacterium pollutisoli]|uniref:Ferredoxin--NADP+ reductase n=1 Tax=Corynebacterium pollutisoli TaxID=1610489 RepID=A0A1X7IZE1_9CORY|nr:hypothetical protein [Corynebacterium pollutisoli]NLP39368.1 hypothetical protein [Corynebacterium pollutisoli]SMG20733.1 ferredoxin--NADP+ reductase [Corynebacterium pollutisoli]HJD78832.1 hypothetical protein [Corynebacterium pollutisoli]